MFSAVMGSLVAFLTIMLLLSMIVTALVQATQSVLRLRARNLFEGVAILLSKYMHVLGRSELHAHVARVLNFESIAGVDRVAVPDSAWRRYVLGPKVSWVAPLDLASTLGAYIRELPAELKSARAVALEDAALLQEIERMQPAWSKRFQFFARLLTIAWSCGIAIGFQLSVPQLLSELSAGAQRADFFSSQSPQVRRMADSGISASSYIAAMEEPVQEQSRAIDQLASFGVHWWPQGAAFYSDEHGPKFDAILGVLMSAILLSLGAPFWFEQLRTLAALRDLREPSTTLAVHPRTGS